MEKVSMEDFERIMSKIWNSGIKSSKIGDFFYTYSSILARRTILDATLF